MKRILPFTAVALFFLVTAVAQTPQPAPPKPEELAEKKVEPPADRKAFTEASGTKDPDKKIQGLEKLIADHPKSALVESARLAILDTLMRNHPTEERRIRGQAKKLIRAAADREKDRLYNQVAIRLLDAGILLNQAEKFSGKSLASMREKDYLERERRGYAERKQTPPPEEELRRGFRSRRAGFWSTLGRVYVKNGKADEGEKLLEEALEASPTLSVAAIALADLAEKAGRDAEALAYLAKARLAGRSSPETVQRLEAAYRKTHGGSLDGIEEALDEAYKKVFPNPLHAEAYKPTAARANRVVLAEVFTGSGCPPCVAADLAFDTALERYARHELAVIVYHKHIPRPDPMTTLDNEPRWKGYSGGGVPTFVIDGKKASGGGPRDSTRRVYERFNPDIEKGLEKPAGVEVQLRASMEGLNVKVQVSVDNLKSESKDLKLQVALVEEMLRYSGENGIRFHPMVVRSLAGPDAAGFPLDAAKPATVEHTFDLAKISDALKAHLDDYEVNGKHGKITFSEKKHRIDPAALAVVAFVQDDKTKEVLQAAHLKVRPPVVSLRGRAQPNAARPRGGWGLGVGGRGSSQAGD